ncbi:immunoglobulin kappa light chain-like [Ctenopharyngodon idella]|uniref:immunoglobulin kappa light chain-like n=1 Tax=Ctenopharyngodon idella TaxID=7959 RepID=UPI00222FBAF8|nr:immunoglobulin kappa light chain-like [Ctenopharyngodon idella]
MMFLYIYIVLLLKMPVAVLGLTVEQDPKALVKAVGKTVYLPCKATGFSSSSDYIHWYQMKDGKAPSRLLYISNDGGVTRDGNNPQANDFTVDKKKLYDLKLSDIKKSHAAVYFCAYWDTSSGHMGNWIKRFGTGTRLIVTDPGKDKINPPTVSAYLSRKTSNKQTMLCHAKDMFPDLVTFTWKKKSNTGVWTDVSEEVMEQSNSENSKVTSVTSMMIVDENTARGNLYKCVANHEGGSSKETELKKDNKDILESDKPGPTCPTNTGDTVKTLKQQRSGNSEQMPSLYLFVYAYGVMLMKNGIYFCAVSIFLLKRKFGKKE